MKGGLDLHSLSLRLVCFGYISISAPNRYIYVLYGDLLDIRRTGPTYSLVHRAPEPHLRGHCSAGEEAVPQDMYVCRCICVGGGGNQ